MIEITNTRILRSFQATSIVYMLFAIADFIIQCVDNEGFNAAYAFLTALIATQILSTLEWTKRKMNRELIMESNIADQLRRHQEDIKVLLKEHQTALLGYSERSEKREIEREKRETEREKRETEREKRETEKHIETMAYFKRAEERDSETREILLEISRKLG